MGGPFDADPPLFSARPVVSFRAVSASAAYACLRPSAVASLLRSLLFSCTSIYALRLSLFLHLFIACL